MTNIPFLDLNTPHLELEADLVSVFKSALRTSAFVGGSAVDSFERDYADYCATKYCVGVGSGTEALLFALIAAGVKQDDVVITVPNTFIATTEAISQAGAIPEFVDVDRHVPTTWILKSSGNILRRNAMLMRKVASPFAEGRDKQLPRSCLCTSTACRPIWIRF